MSHNGSPCFDKINTTLISSYVELPCKRGKSSCTYLFWIRPSFKNDKLLGKISAMRSDFRVVTDSLQKKLFLVIYWV